MHKGPATQKSLAGAHPLLSYHVGDVRRSNGLVCAWTRADPIAPPPPPPTQSQMQQVQLHISSNNLGCGCLVYLAISKCLP